MSASALSWRSSRSSGDTANPRTPSGWERAVGKIGASRPSFSTVDWTFVTKNSMHFRDPANEPGSKGQYADVAIHVGLICLNGPEGIDLDLLRDRPRRGWKW